MVSLRNQLKNGSAQERRFEKTHCKRVVRRKTTNQDIPLETKIK